MFYIWLAHHCCAHHESVVVFVFLGLLYVSSAHLSITFLLTIAHFFVIVNLRSGGDIMKNRIKHLRKSLNMTQEQFANRLNIKRNTLANYEIGRNEPIDAVVSLICREYSVNEDWLRYGTGDMFTEIDKENQLMTWAGNVLKDESDSFRRRFVNMLMELDEDGWEALEKMCLLLNKKD